jgi:hypothetical protein
MPSVDDHHSWPDLYGTRAKGADEVLRFGVARDGDGDVGIASEPRLGARRHGEPANDGE